MNPKTILEIVTMAFAVSLVAVQSVGNVFADDDGDSLAASQVNDCGNGPNPIDVFCQNINQQIQGDDNDADASARQDSDNNPLP